jgi:hypothetical protein
MSNPASGTNIPALDTTLQTLVASALNPAITSVQVEITCDDPTFGVTMPIRTEAWSNGVGLIETQAIRLNNIGPASVIIVDGPPQLTVLPARWCVEITPLGAVVTRIW